MELGSMELVRYSYLLPEANHNSPTFFDVQQESQKFFKRFVYSMDDLPSFPSV